jgi:prevent-host-death family protein
MKDTFASKQYPPSKSEPAVLRESLDGTVARSVTVRDAKAHLSALLEWVSGGREVMITSDGEPKARLVPASVAPRKIFSGMGQFLLGQPIQRGPTADELIREERDSRD